MSNPLTLQFCKIKKRHKTNCDKYFYEFTFDVVSKHVFSFQFILIYDKKCTNTNPTSILGKKVHASKKSKHFHKVFVSIVEGEQKKVQWAKYHNRHTSINIWVTRLLFCQYDLAKEQPGHSNNFWTMPIMIFSPVCSSSKSISKKYCMGISHLVLGVFCKNGRAFSTIWLAIEFSFCIHGQIEVSLNSPNSVCPRWFCRNKFQYGVFVCWSLFCYPSDLSVIHEG